MIHTKRKGKQLPRNKSSLQIKSLKYLLWYTAIFIFNYYWYGRSTIFGHAPILFTWIHCLYNIIDPEEASWSGLTQLSKLFPAFKSEYRSCRCVVDKSLALYPVVDPLLLQYVGCNSKPWLHLNMTLVAGWMYIIWKKIWEQWAD